MDQQYQAAMAEVAARFVREEIERLAASGHNWKVILHGSAGGEIRAVVETHQVLPRQEQLVICQS